MRFKWADEGTKRIRTGFLFFPLTIGGETRWFEKATWEERVTRLVSVFSGSDRGWDWERLRWIDGEEIIP